MINFYLKYIPCQFLMQTPRKKNDVKRFQIYFNAVNRLQVRKKWLIYIGNYITGTIFSLKCLFRRTTESV